MGALLLSRLNSKYFSAAELLDCESFNSLHFNVIPLMRETCLIRTNEKQAVGRECHASQVRAKAMKKAVIVSLKSITWITIQ